MATRSRSTTWARGAAKASAVFGYLANLVCEFQSVTSSAKRSGEESSARWHKQKDTVWLKTLRSQRGVRC